MKFEDVHYAAVQIKNGEAFQLGNKRQSENLRRYNVDVLHNVQGRENQVGRLSIESNLDAVMIRLSNKFWLILISQGIKTFLVSFFILCLIYYFVNRHLRVISDFARELNIENKNEFLTLA